MKKKKSLLTLLLFVMLAAGNLFPAVVKAASTFTEKKVVVLDPGHGGIDSGVYQVIGGQAYKESDINWKICYYTMQELKKYPYLEVYCTREKNQYVSLKDRTALAEAYGADLMVSLHINSDVSGTARGASVLISKGTYRPYLAEKEKLFGSYVISELKKLGLSVRNASEGGMEYRLSQDGSRYANGGRKDFYSIVNQCVSADLPGVIIEHAFLTNRYDAYNFLRTNKQLKALGQADARAIVKYFEKLSSDSEKKDSVVQNSKTGWKKSGSYYYYYINGKKQKNRILKLQTGTYYVDKKGRCCSGWKTIDGSTYYFGSDGKACTGMVKIKNDTYYFNSVGVMGKNVKVFSSPKKMYLFGADGKRYSGWCTYRGQRYYIGAKGYAQRGWLNYKKKWYYFDGKTGVMCKDCTLTNSKGDTYKFNKNGVCTNKT